MQPKTQSQVPHPKLQNFQVRLYSTDGKNSPILEYILELLQANKEFGLEALVQLRNLPEIMYLGRPKALKVIKNGKFKCYQLRVKHKNNICRFFFVIQQPNYIVIHGFTKKTQKTDKKDLKRGEKNLNDYLETKNSILFDF
jgi:phage-related protein